MFFYSQLFYFVDYIQHIYAKERFGDRPTMKSMLKMTRTQVSVEGDLSCNIDGRSSSFSNEEDFIPVEVSQCFYNYIIFMLLTFHFIVYLSIKRKHSLSM